MGLIEKTYYTLAEVMARWGVPRTDVVYLAENGILRLSVRVFGVSIERGEYEEADEGRWFRVPHEQARFNGLLDLTERDAFTLFREGGVTVEQFHADGRGYVCIIDPSPPVEVAEADLVVRAAERDRFEATLQQTRTGTPTVPPAPVAAIDDFREVRAGGLVFHLGAIQAEVVRLLHMAAVAGKPWCPGKQVLAQAGSQSTRMADVFKSQPGWRRLIESDGRGQYRLTLPEG